MHFYRINKAGKGLTVGHDSSRVVAQLHELVANEHPGPRVLRVQPDRTTEVLDGALPFLADCEVVAFKQTRASTLAPMRPTALYS